MKKLFIESRHFTEILQDFLDEDSYASLQNQLMQQPDSGKVMPGCGGLRKLRISDPRRQKGKRGGARLIYLHVSEVDWVFLVTIYGKDEKLDLLPQEKRVLKQLAEEFKRQALHAVSKRKPESEHD